MLQVKGIYRGQMQDGDHTHGHYITLFAEQLTRPFEVLVKVAYLECVLHTTLIVLDSFSTPRLSLYFQ